MPGPAAFFSTIGAVSAAGAAVYAAKMQSLSNFQQVRSTYSSYNENNVNVNLPTSYSYTSNKKLRLGHRNDIHVLMFVVSKD
ncbi:hypothetical protein [Parasitella parasitica]|uniref:Uncharacterized protein n=1 Tax=Parasitella parasitica TaxID=35722 RepID=A0A0B7MUT9_9FUNG|nr:hypothetical protein [Parasitella parasitica]